MAQTGSCCATADEVENMPKNFYSLTLPNSIGVKAFSTYLLNSYSNKDLFVLSQTDCKSCSQVSEAIINDYSKVNPRVKISQYSMLQQQANSIDIKKVVGDFNFKNGIVLLPDMSWFSSIMMFRITNYAQMPVIFIGGDDWGSWNDGVAGKLKANYYYQAFRITPWSPDSDLPQSVKFRQLYNEKYHQEPDNISYVAYSVLSSVIAALNKNPSICGDIYTQSCILISYQKALNADPNWFRSTNYYVYKVDITGEKYLGPIFTAK